MILTHRGGIALSEFRINKFLNQIRQFLPAVQSIHTEFYHFIHAQDEPGKSEQHSLESLLQYGQPALRENPQGLLLLVVPRPGTISPWSSKATDILHNCGLEKISRVERGIAWFITTDNKVSLEITHIDQIKTLIHDRMTETVFTDLDQAAALFHDATPEVISSIDILQGGKKNLLEINFQMGLALSDDEIDYLLRNFQEIGRNPTDVELMMFAQINSEHCRHKIFNADWIIDNNKQDQTLFDLIQATYKQNPGRILSAYQDNAAVTSGYPAYRFFPDSTSHSYQLLKEDVHILMKVETHNHPTAISPRPGASTGAGGEIRDEAATGRGAKPKAGLTGFSVSNLHIPDFEHPWEENNGKPDRIVSALDIMLDGPIGAASFNNEFGRPALCGYFRTYEQTGPNGRVYGYHKPIMLAGGYGMIRKSHIQKNSIPQGASLVVLGGPAMLIGVGGGAASSMASGESEETLDFASVQRDNPEMQRRCQEVIDACWAMDEANPVISIHDVGAGGLSNALPELVHAGGRGALFQLRKIPNAESEMSPMAIWCNEAQERYVLAIQPDAIKEFDRLCKRERAPYAVIGEAINEKYLILNDELYGNRPIDMPLNVLLGKLPRQKRLAKAQVVNYPPINTGIINLDDAIYRILHLPAVADKRFLITIGDRSVSGLVVRDQMVGPWQTPVADCAITAGGYEDYVGEAMAVGERTPLALVNAPASGRMAIGEAVTNIAAARILQLEDIVLSANWMAHCGVEGDDALLYATVKSVSEFCRQLGLAIPVGKDSLSMNTVWQVNKKQKQITAPLSLIISAFAPVADIRQSLTPQLKTDNAETVLLLIDLGHGKNRIGGTCLAQIFNHVGSETPDLDNENELKMFFHGIQILNEIGLILAYHDRSDGGLFVTLCEMAFAGRTGLDLNLDNLQCDVLTGLFNEEIGAIIQVRKDAIEKIKKEFPDSLSEHIHIIGTLNNGSSFRIKNRNETIWSENIYKLHRIWSETSYRMQALRDNPECALEEFDSLLDHTDPGLTVHTTFEPDAVPLINTGKRPPIAILREQGVNGHQEMAAAFNRAGFECIDVHMSDIIDGRIRLTSFRGLAACGGFSYGDVLGAGGGWARSILYNPIARDEFENFFNRKDVFGLGVCNGCQMFSHLRELIPGAKYWPNFIRNRSEQFESRLVMVEVMESPSILLQGMAGSRIPIIVAHGEGRSRFRKVSHNKAIGTLRFIDNHGNPAVNYPANPNGSTGGVTGFTTPDGRFTIMMPHPERVFLTKQFSWIPENWNKPDSPWMQLFLNARKWLE